MAEQQTTPPSPDRHVLQPHFCAREAAKPSSPEKNGSEGGSGLHRKDTEQRARRPREFMPAKVNLQGVLLPARGPFQQQPLTIPLQGSNLMKGIKEPITTRDHCTQL